jgi:hypothetical protein
VSLASFRSFGNAILAPAVALYALIALWFRDRDLRAVVGAWRGWIALLVGGYSVWAIYTLATGISVLRILEVTGQVQASLRGAYSYRLWLGYNLLDILAMSGFAISLPLLIESVGWLAPGRCRQSEADHKIASAAPVLTFAATILAINLSGLSPGEVARLWLHLTTGMIIAATIWLNRTRRSSVFVWLVGLMALQSLWLTLFLRVSETGMPSYAPRNASISVAAPVEPLARFDQGLVLTEASVAPIIRAPGEELTVTLTWWAGQRTEIPYTSFVHLVDASGELVTQVDAMPVDNTYPTTCWVSGEIVEDALRLDLPSTAAPGLYSLRIGWYDLVTMERLMLVGSADDAFVLHNAVEIR